MTLTLLLSVRQDFPCSEEQKMTMSDKLTVRRKKSFNYRLRQQVPTVVSSDKKDIGIAVLLFMDLV